MSDAHPGVQDSDVQDSDVQALGDAAVPALRAARRRKRTANLEWFEVLYRAYVIAFLAGYAVLWLSALVKDDKVSASQLVDVRANAPAIIGALWALVALAGLRSGSRGGPLAVEDADLRHMLLAPVDRRRVMLRPTVQRMRSLAFGGTVVGLIAGQAAGRRLPTSMYRWAGSFGLTGACLGLTFGALAVIAHSRRLPEAWSTVIGGALLGAQGLAVFNVTRVGPLDSLGHLALWPVRFRLVDLVAVVVVVGLVTGALWLSGRVSLERLARRSALVAQLRFAATMQDLRTVMLLRRQLSLEAVRKRPWFKVPKIGGVYWRRGWLSIARFPARRVIRMSMLAAAGSAALFAAYKGTTIAVVVSGLAAFMFGLETIEPLAQHLDHPDIGDLQPVSSSSIQVRLLPVTGILLVLFGAAAGVVTALVARSDGSGMVVGAMVGIAAGLGGGIGAIVNAVTGAPDPTGSRSTAAVMPPEVAGMAAMYRMTFAPALSVLCSLPILAVRRHAGDPEAQLAIAGRSLIGVGVAVVMTVGWVHARPRFKAWWRKTQAEAQQARTGVRR